MDSSILKKAYDPTIFREQGHQLIDALANYLEQSHRKEKSMKILPWVSPDDLLLKWERNYAQPINSNPQHFFSEVIAETIHMHHPHYIGHQTSNILPVAALAELLGGFLDPGMGIFEQGTTGVVLEKMLITQLAKKMGMTEEAEGFFTSGGTLGNLTALLCARQTILEKDSWEHGYEGKQYGFMVSSEAHYSVAKAIKTMGLGEKGVVLVPVDSSFRLNPDLLESCFQNAEKEGIKIIGVIANACSTAVGAYDDINAIADFCEQKKLWLHVDAAHGGAAIYSKKYKNLLKGIERADSVILDYHKMLMVPTLVTAVVFRNGKHSYQTFAQKASYLWEQDESLEWYNLGKRTYELTKTAMSFRIYAILKTYGEAIFEENVNVLYDMGIQFAKLISEDSVFQMPLEKPSSNIVCFRFWKAGLSETQLENINSDIRKTIVKEGSYYFVQTKVGETLYLRVTVMNPFTTIEDLKNLLTEIKSIGMQMLDK